MPTQVLAVKAGSRTEGSCRLSAQMEISQNSLTWVKNCQFAGWHWQPYKQSNICMNKININHSFQPLYACCVCITVVRFMTRSVRYYKLHQEILVYTIQSGILNLSKIKEKSILMKKKYLDFIYKTFLLLWGICFNVINMRIKNYSSVFLVLVCNKIYIFSYS